MTSTIRLKWGGPWLDPIADGNLRVKWGGPWISPAYCYHKVGDVGGGYWRDTGYRGYPNPPQGIGVYGWDFNNVSLYWGGPAAGGAPTVAYHLVQTDSAGNWINQVEVGGSPWGNFGVGEDGYYQFYVRSKSAAGLYSGFVGPVRVKIGHTEQGYYANENRIRGWYNQISGNWYQNNYSGGPDQTVIWVPNNVRITEFHYSVLANAGFTSVLSPFGNRKISHIFAGQDWGDTISMGNPYQTVEYGFNNWGGDNWWGLIARGAGWTVSPNGTARMVGDFGIYGEETYQVTVYYMTRAYEGNSYW